MANSDTEISAEAKFILKKEANKFFSKFKPEDFKEKSDVKVDNRRNPGDVDPNENYIIVKTISGGFNAGNFAKIILNNKQIDVEKNQFGHYRGLHVVAICPSTGKVNFARVFDTYKSSEAFEHLIKRNVIPLGHIVAAACKDDCVTKLSDLVQGWFEYMGSEEIKKLTYR